MIRRSLAVLAAALAAPSLLAAQPDTTLAKSFRVNFAVPDAPAFDILDIDPSKVLRPSSVQELGVALSNFADEDYSLSIPRSFALELAPYLLARGRTLTLADYQRSRFLRPLYTLRLSVGTNRTADSARTQLGFGVRVNLLDRADPRMDRRLVAALTANAREINRIYSRVLTTRPLADTTTVRLKPQVLSTDAARADVERLQKRSRELRERYADENWNEWVLNVAYALRVSAADSLGHDPRTDAHSFWATLGVPVSSFGQLLVGARGGLGRQPDDDDFREQASVAARFYAGSNDYKLFVEGEWRRDDDDAGDADTGFFVQGGGELNLIDWAWASFSFGTDRSPDDGDRRLVTRLSIKTALPGLP